MDSSTVMFYGTKGCQPCRATQRKLDSLGVQYTYTDINTDEEALNRIKGLGYQQVPVLVKGDVHFSGFQPDRIAALA